METTTERKVEFVCNAIKWFDKVNGNTYHSVRITRCNDSEVIFGEFTYGYGDHYRQTALEVMNKAGWLAKYAGKDIDELYMFERENEYPIMWNVSDGLKRDCVANGVL